MNDFPVRVKQTVLHSSWIS